jgi:hypothetical protein
MSALDIGNEEYTLMSHAGGYSKNIFHLNKTFYDSLNIIDTTGIEKDDTNMYYDYMESYRKKFLETNDILINNTEYDSLMDCINGINSFYVDFIEKIFNKEGNVIADYIDLINTDANFRNNYFILQALGLKPTLILEGKTEPDHPENKNSFVSPIESCSSSGGCVGFDPFNDQKNDDVVSLFSRKKIKFVTHGHMPHCATVPLIYERTTLYQPPIEQTQIEETKIVQPLTLRVIFVCNDKSVGGFTPSYYTKLNEIPLSFITSTKVGICSLEEYGSITFDKIRGYNEVNKDNKQTDKYKELIRQWKVSDPNFPKLVESGKFYGITFKSEDSKKDIVVKIIKSRAPLQIDISEPKIAGGRKRCSKKMIRKCKRMTKRMRAKMGCGHCC